MRGEAIVQLVHGTGRGGVRHREAVLRALTGNDEALLAECPAILSPAACATELLAVATQRIGTAGPVDRAMVADLALGDRERLLLTLCGMTFGAALDLVACCPECGAASDVEVRIADILGATPPPAADTMALWPETTEGRWHLRFRLPTGRDQEIAAAAPDRAEAVAALMADCVVSCTDPAGVARGPEEAVQRFGGLLGAAFERMDPGVEAMTVIDCGECGVSSPALLDAFAILHTGLARGERVGGDTYLMARHYHWSERDILALPIARRRRYLNLVAGEAGQ